MIFEKIDLRVLKDLHLSSAMEYDKVVQMRRYCECDENRSLDFEGFASFQRQGIWKSSTNVMVKKIYFEILKNLNIFSTP